MNHRPRQLHTSISLTRSNALLSIGADDFDVPDDKFLVHVLLTEHRDGDGWSADVQGVESWDGEKWVKDELSIAEKLQIELIAASKQEREDIEDEALEDA